MNYEVLLKNSHSAELILNFTLHVIIVSVLGWLVLKIWKPNSAPVKGGCYLALLFSLAILPVFCLISHFYQISWSKTSIHLPPSPPVHVAAVTSPDDDIGQSNEAKGSKSIQSQKTIPKERDNLGLRHKFNPFQSDRLFMAINVFGIVWILGFLILLGRLVYGVIFLFGYVSSLVELKEKRVYHVLDSVKRMFGDKPSPKIYVCPTLSSPITVGLRRPSVILPLDLSNTMTDDELRCVLFHELSHIYHYDHIVGIFQRILTAFYWWNPFVYSISAGFSISREEVSDNYVIEGLKNPRLYAENLLNLAKKTCLISRLPATAGMASSHLSLEDRVRSILKKGRLVNTALNPTYAFLLLMSALILASSAVGMKGSFANVVYPEFGFKKTAYYRIQGSPGTRWIENTFQFNNQYGFSHDSRKANIAVGTMIKEKYVTKAVNEGLLKSESQGVDVSLLGRMWIQERGTRFHWKDVTTIEEGETRINGRKVYWHIFEYARAAARGSQNIWEENFDYTQDSTYLKNSIGLKGKVYVFDGDNHCFRIWLTCAKDYFDEVIKDFEGYVKTFETSS